MFEEKIARKTVKTVAKKEAPIPKKVAPTKKLARTKKEVVLEADEARHKLSAAKKTGNKEEIQKYNKLYNNLSDEAAKLRK